MTYEDAIAWLQGRMSTCNTIQIDEGGQSTWIVRTAQADAAATQQAYWVVKAHREGLVSVEAKGGVK